MFRCHVVLPKNVCSFHTTYIFNNKGARAMRKVMGYSKKRKFHPADIPTLPVTSNIFGKTSFETKVTGNPRRSTVLNKLFMRHITDLMATGEYSNQIIGYGIEVNKVQITSDYNVLKVYWIAKHSEDYNSIDNILTKNAGFLRHELSQLRVMGKVPNIVFVKDKNYSRVVEVEKILATADFGQDYKQTDLALKLKSDPELWATLQSSVKTRLEKLDLDTSEYVDVSDEVPSMPQNVLGLDHADIWKRVKKGMSVSEALHRKDVKQQNEWTDWSQFKKTQIINSDPVTYSSQQHQRQAFKEFWQKRQILKTKERRLGKNWTPDIELLKEEAREMLHSRLENEDVEIENDDYIVDHFDEGDEKI